MITITNEDNMKLMARYEDNYFDLAIVDPPYGININSSGTHFKEKYEVKDWDKNTPTTEYFEELKRVSKTSSYLTFSQESEAGIWVEDVKENPGLQADIYIRNTEAESCKEKLFHFRSDLV